MDLSTALSWTITVVVVVAMLVVRRQCRLTAAARPPVIGLNEGEPTRAEVDLGLVFSDIEQMFAEERWPDESDVMALAERWSLDPQTLGADGLKVGLGFLGQA